MAQRQNLGGVTRASEAIAPGSNEHEMFFYNLDTIGTDLADPILEAITAHEFQHMIRANVDATTEALHVRSLRLYRRSHGAGYPDLQPSWCARRRRLPR